MLKRSADLILAAVAMVLLAPLAGLVALLIRIRMGSPVFFRQVRPGFMRSRSR